LHHKLLSWEKEKGFWEKLVLPRAFENKVYAKFGGQTECIMGDLKIEDIMKT